MTAREHPSLPFVFRLIEDAAVRGVRCPSTEDITRTLYRVGRRVSYATIGDIVRRLVKLGQIRIEGRHPLRIATILVGPHAGKSTAAHSQASPWSIEDLERRGKELQAW